MKNTILEKSPVQGDPRNPIRCPLDGGIQENYQKEIRKWWLSTSKLENIQQFLRKWRFLKNSLAYFRFENSSKHHFRWLKRWWGWNKNLTGQFFCIVKIDDFVGENQRCSGGVLSGRFLWFDGMQLWKSLKVGVVGLVWVSATRWCAWLTEIIAKRPTFRMLPFNRGKWLSAHGSVLYWRRRRSFMGSRIRQKLRKVASRVLWGEKHDSTL